MFYNMLSMMESVYNRLRNAAPHLTFYADGFKVGNISLQLRNVPQNIANDIHTLVKLTSFSYTMLTSARGNEQAGWVNTSSNQALYVSFQSQRGINYAVSGVSMGLYKIPYSIIGSTCGLEYHGQTSLYSNYALVRDLNGSVKLWSDEAGSDPNTEYCIENILQNVITQTDRSNGAIAGYVFAGLGGACFSLFLMYKLCKYYQTTKTAETDIEMGVPQSHSKDEKVEVSSTPITANNTSSEISSKKPTFFQPSPPVQSEPLNKSMASRLEEIGVVDVPNKDFICPITQVIMTDPCITDDGHTYERKELDNLKAKNSKCPMDDEKEIVNIIPNCLLRGEIITFVEQEEEKKRNEIKIQM